MIRASKELCPVGASFQTMPTSGPEESSGASPRSPGTHIVGPWVTDNIKLYRVLRTGSQYVGNWASRVD